jgi:hypothetical protein
VAKPEREKMKFTSNIKLRTAVFLVIIVIASVSCNGGGGGNDWEPPPEPSGGDDQPPPPQPLPDLSISAIEVFPAQPQAGQYFSVNVYVTNIGEAQSGEYDLAIFIKDVSRGSTYPVGTFRNEGLYPGENIPAYTSSDRLVNDPGSFQVHVEIQPFLFEDGNEQNNTLIWAFTVQ